MTKPASTMSLRRRFAKQLAQLERFGAATPVTVARRLPSDARVLRLRLVLAVRFAAVGWRLGGARARLSLRLQRRHR
jgi:hypothetical protein